MKARDGNHKSIQGQFVGTLITGQQRIRPHMCPAALSDPGVTASTFDSSGRDPQVERSAFVRAFRLPRSLGGVDYWLLERRAA